MRANITIRPALQRWFDQQTKSISKAEYINRLIHMDMASGGGWSKTSAEIDGLTRDIEAALDRFRL